MRDIGGLLPIALCAQTFLRSASPVEPVQFSVFRSGEELLLLEVCYRRV